VSRDGEEKAEPELSHGFNPDEKDRKQSKIFKKIAMKIFRAGIIQQLNSMLDIYFLVQQTLSPHYLKSRII